MFSSKQGTGHHCLGVLSSTGGAVPEFAVEQPEECWGLSIFGVFFIPHKENSFQKLWSCPSGFQSSAKPILGLFTGVYRISWPGTPKSWHHGMERICGKATQGCLIVPSKEKRDPDSANCTETRELGGLKL